jgi:hypothetical protein
MGGGSPIDGTINSGTTLLAKVEDFEEYLEEDQTQTILLHDSLCPLTVVTEPSGNLGLYETHAQFCISRPFQETKQEYSLVS